jgi:hypothetical protein
MQSIENSSRTVEQQAGKKEEGSKTDAKRREEQKVGSRKEGSQLHACAVIEQMEPRRHHGGVEWSVGAMNERKRVRGE